jgi:nucleoside-diphosphate-sugar epimerase
MKNLLEADYIFFGFGKITENIINALTHDNQKIICVSNLPKLNNLSPKITWFAREEIIHNRVRARQAIFAWNNSFPLNDKQMMNWIKSEELLLDNSFLLSSSSVYKDSKEILSEDLSNLEPTYLYNEKYNLETNLTELFRYKENQHTNLRISNVYGKGLTHGLIASLLNSISSTNPPTIFQQKDIVRDYLYLKDLIFAIEKLAKLNNTEASINISTGVGVTIHEVLETFKEHGYNFDSCIEVNAPSQLKKSVVLDSKLLRTKVSWAPACVKDGISDLFDESGL